MRRLFVVLCLMLAVGGAAVAQSDLPQFSLVMQIGRGHTTTAAWSPDSSRLAVATSAGVWIYDVADWDAEPLYIPTSYTTSWVEFSPGGALLAVGLGDGTASAYDAATGTWLDYIIAGPVPERGAMANFNRPVRAASFIPATAAPGRTPNGAIGDNVLNDADGTELRLHAIMFVLDGEPEPVANLSTSDNTMVVTLERDRVTVTETADQGAVIELPGYSLPVYDIGFSALGDALLVHQLGSTVRVYDTATGADMGEYPAAWPSRSPLIYAVDPESQRAAVVVANRNVQVISPSVGAQTLTGPEGAGVAPRSLAFERGGERLAVGYSDGIVGIYDHFSDDPNDRRTGAGHFGHVLALAWLDDGYIISGGEDGLVKYWILDDPMLTRGLFGSHADEVTTVAVSPADPTLFATGSIDGTVKLWRLER